MTHLLQDLCALVTGASRGLGREIALHLARAGANVALTARQIPGDVMVQMLAARADPAQRLVAIEEDLAAPGGPDRVADAALTAFTTIDILVNNAAVQGPIGAFPANDFDAWRHSFDVNLFAPARLIQRLLPAMTARGRGKIINLSGGGAASPRPDFSAYGAAKCALVRLTETLAEELRSDWIDINAIAPGAMNTRMLDEVLAAGPSRASREFAAAQARHRDGGASPARAAELAVFLASEASDGISGKLISAIWDPWPELSTDRSALAGENLTLRRVTPHREMRSGMTKPRAESG